MKNKSFNSLIILILSMFLLSVQIQFTYSEPAAYTYSDMDCSDESTEFNMGSVFYIEINAPNYNDNPSDIDSFSFKVNSTINPEGVNGFAEETDNNTGIFRDCILLSYEHSSDGAHDLITRIMCNRNGDNVTIAIDADNNGINEESIKIKVLYSAENNLQQDVWNFEWATFLPMFIVGILIALVPKKLIDKIFSKIPIVGSKFEAGYKYIDTTDKTVSALNPLYFWRLLLSDMITAIIFFIIKMMLLAQEIPAEYVAAGLQVKYVIFYGFADAVWSLVSFAVGYAFPMAAKELIQSTNQ
ncbi:MAG: hypothetical protein GF364_13360 [Candidatus Lokiarchaeota archaeon]|nr:hypothetical protein [Candidatus Lokiarchaeota archaeon]